MRKKNALAYAGMTIGITLLAFCAFSGLSADNGDESLAAKIFLLAGCYTFTLIFVLWSSLMSGLNANKEVALGLTVAEIVMMLTFSKLNTRAILYSLPVFVVSIGAMWYGAHTKRTGINEEKQTLERDKENRDGFGFE